MNRIIETITSEIPEIRNRSVEELLEGESSQSLLNLARDKDHYRSAGRSRRSRVWH